MIDRQTDRHTMTAYTALSIASRGKNVSRDITTPLSGTLCHCRLGLARVNLYSKYEVSTLTHYEDMKGDEKSKIGVFWGVRGHPRSSETSPFDRAHMTSYSTLIETVRLSCTVFELQRVFRRK